MPTSKKGCTSEPTALGNVVSGFQDTKVTSFQTQMWLLSLPWPGLLQCHRH